MTAPWFGVLPRLTLCLGLLALVGGGDEAQAEDVPRELACLAKWYGGDAVRDEQGWALRLAAGQRLAFDDGRKKSAEERIEAPSLKDVFAPVYRVGAVRAVTDPDEDPGRARIDALFEQAYPPSRIKAVPFFGSRLLLHEKALPALSRVIGRLHKAISADSQLLPFLYPIGGSYAARNIAGTTRRSAHAFAIAVDLNVKKSFYWRWRKGAPTWRNSTPQAIVDAFEAEGFIWGGRWFHYDTMHFEYRPELLDPECRP